MSDSLAYAGALTQARLVRERQVSPVELVQLYLDRIARFDGPINSYVTVTPELALEAARRAEAALGNPDLPPFHGVPISIKDLNPTAGIRTTFGLVNLRDYVPTADDHIVSRLKAAGFIILGKTNTPEVGLTCLTEPPAYGPTRNPWNLERTPGGSSGGAAAALAAGLCPAAHGSDGAGSIRIPAALCGVVGLKPSRGRILSPLGALAAAPNAVEGPLTWTVADAAALLDVMVGPATGPDLWGLPPEPPFLPQLDLPLPRLRVAVSDSGVTLAPGNRRALERAVQLLGELGHDVEWDEPEPRWGAYFFDRLFCERALDWQAVARRTLMVDDRPGKLLHPANTWLLARGEQVRAVDYVLEHQRIQKDMATWAAKSLALTRRYDVFLTPVVSGPPLPVGLHEKLEPYELWRTMAEFCSFTPMASFAGQPAISLPLEEDDQGLPVGIQLVGRPAGEALLLRLAAQIEEARPWHQRRPLLQPATGASTS